MPKSANFKAAKKDDTAEILIYDDIGPSWMGMIGADYFAQALKDLGSVKEISLRINSAGGSVFEGLAIYNQLVKHSARVIVDVDGIAASISSVIAMAGDEIRIAKNAMLMIHDPEAIAFGGVDEMLKTAELLEDIKNSIVTLYSDRTGQSAESIAAMMAEETWLTADKAKEHGFANTITPNKAVTNHVDPGRFKNAPQDLFARSKAGEEKIGNSSSPEPMWRRELAKLWTEIPA